MTATNEKTVDARHAARALGKEVRARVPRRSHAGWSAPEGRDPIAILEEQNANRVPQLVPVRMGRMAESPFAFYRGAAAVMASDLAPTSVSGIEVQACGDAHLVNFGLYASPERTLLFDVNDFDETLRAPWEWDVKRLAASAVVAARQNGFDEPTARQIARAGVRSYRERMGVFAEMDSLDLYYTEVDAESVLAPVQDGAAESQEGAREDQAEHLRPGAQQADRHDRRRCPPDPAMSRPSWST